MDGSAATPPRRSSPATIKDVARLAGVSTGLASMALSDHPSVATASKATVLRAAAELDYVPNSVGKALRARRLGAIAVVIPHSSHHVFSHPYFIHVLEGVTEVASANDLTVVLSTARAEEDEEAAYVRMLRSRRADGVIVAAAAIADRNIARLAASGYPMVVLGRDPQATGVSSVVVDDVGGARRVVEHLIAAHGCRRIAHITGPLGYRSALDKHDGYRAALGEADLPAGDELVVESDYSEAGGAEACERLIAAGVAFDGLFTANDQMAFGALQTLRRHGVEVPRDLALAGFDDIALASVIRPSLTTIHQPMADIGRLATTELIALLGDGNHRPRQVDLATCLVVRTSCGCEGEDALADMR